MSFGIICASDYDEYTLFLIKRLMAAGQKPDFILYSKRPLFLNLKFFFEYLHHKSFTENLKIILSHMRILQAKHTAAFDNMEICRSEINITSRDFPLSKICKKEGIDFKIVKDINSSSTVEYVKKYAPKVLLNTSATIIRTSLIKAVSIGILNCHTGFLPKYRGVDVMEWSIFYQDKIGVTLHFIDVGVDTGDIIAFQEIPILSNETLDDIQNKVFNVRINLMLKMLPTVLSGNSIRKKQAIEEGRQYFAMHSRIKAMLNDKVKNYRK